MPIVRSREVKVVTGLAPVNNSRVRSYAIFENDPALFGDDRTEVTVYLFERLPYFSGHPGTVVGVSGKSAFFKSLGSREGPRA